MIWFLGPLVQMHFEITERNSVLSAYVGKAKSIAVDYTTIHPWKVIIFVSFYFIHNKTPKKKIIDTFARHLGQKNGYSELKYV
jgi:sulfur relay (sulfurtransferase) DsrC/TusE family protein